MERTPQLSTYPFLIRRGAMYQATCETVEQLPIQLTSLMLTATDLIASIATDLRQSDKSRKAFVAKDIFGRRPLAMRYDFSAYVDEDSDMSHANVDIVSGDTALSVVESIQELMYRLRDKGSSRRSIAIAYCDKISNPANCVRLMNRRHASDHLDNWTYDVGSVGTSRTLYVQLGAPDGYADVEPVETLPFFEQPVRLQVVQNGPNYFDTVQKVNPAEIPVTVFEDALIAKRGIEVISKRLALHPSL